MPSTKTATTPPKELWENENLTADEYMKAKYPNNPRKLIALGRGRNDKIIKAYSVLREYEGLTKALSFSYRLNMDTQNEEVKRLLVNLVTRRYPDPVTFSKEDEALVPWTGRFANKVDKKLASEAKGIEEPEHKLIIPSNVEAFSQSLLQVAHFDGGVEAIAARVLSMINDSIVPNGLDGAPGEGGRAAGERANNRLEPSNGPDGAQGSPGTGATGGNNANPFEPTGPVSAVGRLAAASANNANPDGAAAAGGRDNDLGQPDGPVVGRPFELNGKIYPLDPNVPERIYPTSIAIDRFFNERPDPEYDDDDDDDEVTVLAVVPPPASSDENSTRSRKDSSDEDDANENESTASTPDGDDFDTISDFDLYPCVECGQQFRGDFPDDSATSLADLQRDGEGLCRDCWDNVLSGASGNDSDDDTLSDDAVSYLTIDDGDDSDRNDNDSNETNDDGDGLEYFDDENSANRNDVQLVVPAHEHGVAAGSAGGQSGDGTPSSSDEAEGRQDAAALARMTTSAPDKGTLVWVAQGRNVNMAVYLGDVSSRDGYELVQVQWKSDNSKDYVYPASISAVDFGSSRGRRRRAPPSDIYIDNEKTKDPPGESLDEDDDDNNHDNKRTTGKSEDSLGGDGDDNNHNNKSTTESSEDALGGNDGGNESKTDNAVMVSDEESSHDHDNGDDGLATTEGGTGEQQTDSENTGQFEQESPNDEDKRKAYRKALLIGIVAQTLAKQRIEGGTGEQQTDSENTGKFEQESSNDEGKRKAYRKALLIGIEARTLAKQKIEGGKGEQQTDSENTGQFKQESPNDEDKRKEYRKALLIGIAARTLIKQSN